MFGIAKLALAAEHQERTGLQGWLEFTEVAVEEDREGFFFFSYSEDKINVIWMLFRLSGHGFLEVY